MVFPSTPVTVMTGSKLFVELITTSQRAVLPTSPTKSCSHVTDCGCLRGLGSRAAMSVCRASLPTAGLPPIPALASQAETTAHTVATAPTAVKTVSKGRLLDRCCRAPHPGVGTDHSKLAAGVMVNCGSGQTTFACAPLL